MSATIENPHLSIKEIKSLIRQKAKSARRNQPENIRRWKNKHIAQRVKHLDILTKETTNSPKTICLYWSLPEEADTHSVTREFLAQGKKVALPCHTGPLCLRLITDPDRDLSQGRTKGVLEPLPHCPVVEFCDIDCFFVPGIAFDIHGHRIGFGGGYYDRILAGRKPNALVYALAYESQMFREVPFDPSHDQKVGAVLTEKNTYTFRKTQKTVSNEDETTTIARNLASVAQAGFRLALEGNLGAGKTAFIKFFVATLQAGQQEKDIVTSPSFVLMNEYNKGPVPVRHIDLYRLGDAKLCEEDLQMFLETVEEYPGIVLIEWANFGKDWLPLEIPKLLIEFQGEQDRLITLETYRAEDLPLHE